MVQLITADNGTEFAGHEEIAKITGADFYFAKLYSSWERCLNMVQFKRKKRNGLELESRAEYAL